jgi:hypothetical protein
MEPVGVTEPPAGSAVMLSCMGCTDPAMVKVAFRGAGPSRPSEIA